MALTNILSVFPKSVAILTLSLSALGLSHTANAGFLDSLNQVQSTLNSITTTANSFAGTGQPVAAANQQGVSQLPEGTVLAGKLKNTKLYAQADKFSGQVALLSNHEIMIFMGSEQNGFYHVSSDKGEGWVSKPLVSIQ